MIKKTAGGAIKSMQNLQLANELHKPIIRKFKKRTVYSSFKDSIWGSDLVDMQVISKFDKIIRFLLCVIDIFSKYVWVVPLREKPYFPSPGISWKAQKDQVNAIFSSTFWLKKIPYFPSPKSSKQELFSNQ